jgi:glycosyltransferase involved in cell wall biosynthesis
MDIGIISEVLGNIRTGIGTYTYHLIDELNKNKYINDRIFLITDSHQKFFDNEEIILPKNTPILKTYPWYLEIPRRLKKADIDIIHNPTQIPTFSRFTKKNIVTVHDITPFLNPNEHPFGVSLYNSIFFPKTLTYADSIIAVSNNTKSDIMHHFGIPEDKITVIYHGIDKQFRPQNKLDIISLREKLGISDPYILYVGTLEPRKNITFLLKAFFQFNKTHKNYKLVITGSKGWKYANIFKMVRDLQLDKEVLFTGYLEYSDLPALYSGASIFVYPSLYEGFGLPPLEAMACGCPVITSNISSLPEIVGDAGVLINPNDILQLVENLEKILVDEELRTELIQKGLERSKLFTWKKCAVSTYEIYEAVYQGKLSSATSINLL